MTKKKNKAKFIHKEIAKPKGIIRKRTITLSKSKNIKAVIGVTKKKGKHGGRTKVLSVLVPKEEGAKKTEKVAEEIKTEEKLDPQKGHTHEKGLSWCDDCGLVWS